MLLSARNNLVIVVGELTLKFTFKKHKIIKFERI